MTALGRSPIDGYWEEGYHYYLEIKGGRAVLRDYAKRVMVETTVKYDKSSLKRGEKTELTLGDAVLSRTASGEPMTWIKSLYYDSGSIVMEHYYTIMGDTTYTLEKVDHGPFDNIIIRDKEILPSLQGLWLEWSRSGPDENEYGLRINKNVLRYGSREHDLFKTRIHAVSYRSSPNTVMLTPEDLTVREFPGMTTVTVEKDMLTSRMIICDADTPLSVFVRRENYDTLVPPPDALRGIVNTMLPPRPEPEPGSSIRVIRQSAPFVCGGTDATVDDSAPKTIASQDMTLFDAASVLPESDMPLADGETPLDRVSAFAAPDGEGSFLFLEKGSRLDRRRDASYSWALVEKNVFPELAELVRRHELASENGYHSVTHGLAEDYGGHIEIKYAGGEYISISDNQSPVLSRSAGESIAAFFTAAMAGDRLPLPELSELKEIRYDETRKDGGFTRAVLTILEDGSGVNKKTQRFSDPTVYESEKEVDADTIAAIIKNIADTGMLAWSSLPESGFARDDDKTLCFVFKDASEITVRDDRALPDRIKGGFFNISLEMTVRH